MQGYSQFLSELLKALISLYGSHSLVLFKIEFVQL